MGLISVLAVLTLALPTLSRAHASRVVLYDASQSYFKPAAADVHLSSDDLPALLAALLSQEAAVGQASQQVYCHLLSRI